MKIAIMQPYFFPYIGYFQLIRAVDKFVFLDDVNFINKGWVNRNRILINAEPSLITVPLIAASQNKKINELFVSDEGKWKSKLLRSIEFNYKKAAQFSQVYPYIVNSIDTSESNLAHFNRLHITWVCDYLGIRTEIVPSSAMYLNQHLKGKDRIIDICVQERADVYVNPPGGKELYHADDFDQRSIQLRFLKSNEVMYKQFDAEFVPWLSIIDVLMFNDKESIARHLNEYKLVEGNQI